MCDYLNENSRRAAVGMCILIMDGEEAAANELMRVYLVDAIKEGFTQLEAFAALARASLSMSMGIARETDAGVDWFRRSAEWLASDCHG